MVVRARSNPQAFFPFSVISTLADIGPAEPSCTSATEWSDNELETESSGGECQFLRQRAELAKIAPRAKSATPAHPRTICSRLSRRDRLLFELTGDNSSPVPFDSADADSADDSSPVPFDSAGADNADNSSPVPFDSADADNADESSPVPFDRSRRRARFRGRQVSGRRLSARSRSRKQTPTMSGGALVIRMRKAPKTPMISAPTNPHITR